MGLSADEVAVSIIRIEGSFSHRPSIAVRLGQHCSWVRESLFVLWGYALGIWVFVIAMQLRFPPSVH